MTRQFRIAVTMWVTLCVNLPLAVASERTTLSVALESQSVYHAMQKVADWQMAQYDPENNAFYEDSSADGHTRGWVYAALYVGLSKWAGISESDRYARTLQALAERNRWTFAPRIYNADDYAIGQLYIDQYERNPDPAYIAPLMAVADIIMTSPSTADLEFKKVEGVYEFYENRRYSIVPCKNRWCWADALFMGPPVWTHLSRITGDSRYLEFADREFWATTDYLLDGEEHLFYRDSRYFDQREANGAKIFWGRGNGWVLAGITRILEQLPADHVNRTRYEAVFRKMSHALVRAQTDEGYWLTSLLSPGTFSNPESSGTGFIVYGLAWGVNNGLLDANTFGEPIRKGWQSLIRAVHPDGKLGWVQQVASKPGSATYEDTQLYGVGAFLLAGSQVFALADSGRLD